MTPSEWRCKANYVPFLRLRREILIRVAYVLEFRAHTCLEFHLHH